MSDIQDYIEYIIREHETLTAVPPIHVYINRINNRLVFKIKDGSTKKLIYKTKTGENVPSLEVVEVVLGQCNLVDNQYQQKPFTRNNDKIYFCDKDPFTPNKSYAYLLNVELSNLVFLGNL